eukprot:6016607-Amphidinium_carterae.1
MWRKLLVVRSLCAEAAKERQARTTALPELTGRGMRGFAEVGRHMQHPFSEKWVAEHHQTQSAFDWKVIQPGGMTE